MSNLIRYILAAAMVLLLINTTNAQSDVYAVVIQNKCMETLSSRMKDMSVRGVQRVCQCVSDTVLDELSAADIAGTSGNSAKVRTSVNDAYLSCYVKFGR